MRQIDKWAMNRANVLVRDNKGRWCLYDDAAKLVEEKFNSAMDAIALLEEALIKLPAEPDGEISCDCLRCRIVRFIAAQQQILAAYKIKEGTA